MSAVLGGVLLAVRIAAVLLGVVALLAAVLLLLPVGLDIRWSAKEGAVWQAKAGPLRFPLYPFPDQPAGPDTPSATTGKAKRRPKRKPKQPPEAPAPGRRAVPGSVVFVPGAAGLILAGEVVRDLCGV